MAAWKDRAFGARTSLFEEATDEIARKTEQILAEVTKILLNHTPPHLRASAKKMSYLRLFEDAISALFCILYTGEFLKPADKTDYLPTTYMSKKTLMPENGPGDGIAAVRVRNDCERPG